MAGVQIWIRVTDSAELMLVNEVLRQLDGIPLLLLHLRIDVTDIDTYVTMVRRAHALAARHGYDVVIMGRQEAAPPAI